MNAPHKIEPTERQLEEQARDLRAIDKLIDDARHFRDLRANNPRFSGDRIQWAWLFLCEAADDLFSGESAADHASVARDELGIDEEHNPVDEHGYPLRTFNPSRVHPDDPCQSKGYL